MVNDALEKRRKHHEAIIKKAGLYILITLILTLTNIVGIVTKIAWFSLPYGIASVQALFEYGINIIRAKQLYSVNVIFALLGALVLYALLFKCWYSMKSRLLWAKVLFALYALDTAATFILAIINFVPALFTMTLYLVDIGLHVFVLIQLMRAKRSLYALSVLPEKETEEDINDMFAEYRAERDKINDDSNQNPDNN